MLYALIKDKLTNNGIWFIWLWVYMHLLESTVGLTSLPFHAIPCSLASLKQEWLYLISEGNQYINTAEAEHPHHDGCWPSIPVNHLNSVIRWSITLTNQSLWHDWPRFCWSLAYHQAVCFCQKVCVDTMTENWFLTVEDQYLSAKRFTALNHDEFYHTALTVSWRYFTPRATPTFPDRSQVTCSIPCHRTCMFISTFSPEPEVY